nr:hypothetical protein [Tanacetum cinerariifolium]
MLAQEDRIQDCKGVPRNVNPVNVRNPPVRGSRNQRNQARDRAFMLGAEEARQDPNIVTEDILIYSKTQEEHVEHLSNRIYVDPSKIEAVKNWKAPRTPSKKCKTFDWGEKQELAFQTLKDKLCNAPVLAHPDGLKDFVVYCDAFGIGLGYVLMQRVKVRAYASRILAAQKEAVNESVGVQKSLDEMMEQRRADKMYYDLRDRYWWPRMKKDIAEYVRIAMNFVTKLPRTNSGHDTI